MRARIAVPAAIRRAAVTIRREFYARKPGRGRFVDAHSAALCVLGIEIVEIKAFTAP
jgi:hypothetical protein